MVLKHYEHVLPGQMSLEGTASEGRSRSSGESPAKK
jgi:hypothetical protein